MRIQLEDHSLDFTLPWTPLQPCPCGTGQPYCYCCNFNQNYSASGRGLFTCTNPGIVTIGGNTGFAHDRCYLRSLNDCDEKISKEHHISETLLRQLGDKISLSGAIWQNEGETLTTNVASLQSKTLCVRHNSALSILDTWAGRAFSRLQDAAKHAVLKSKQDPYLSIINGPAFELWGIKALAGSYFAKYLGAEGESVFDGFELNINLVTNALFGNGLNSACGLYVAQEQGETSLGQIKSAPLINDKKQLCGMTMQLGAANYNFFLSKENGNAEYFTPANSRYRPNMLIFKGHRNFAAILVKWNRLERNKPVVVTFHLE